MRKQIELTLSSKHKHSISITVEYYYQYVNDSKWHLDILSVFTNFGREILHLISPENMEIIETACYENEPDEIQYFDNTSEDALLFYKHTI